MTLRPLALLLLLLAAATALAACGSEDPEEASKITGDTLTIYSSLPQTGPLAPLSRDIVRGQKLALGEARGRAGKFAVSYVSLDSADEEAGGWTPGRVASNAREAIQDRQTIAYLGELAWGASAVSVPILNEAGVLQVSPRDTFGGLTARGGRGEPEKYFPSGMRSFARAVPGDDEQAEALVALLRERRVRRVVVADDRSVAGSSLSARVTPPLRAAGIEVAERAQLDPGRDVPDDFTRDVRRAGALLFAGASRPFARDVLRAADRAAPSAQLFASDSLALASRPPDGVRLTGVIPAPADAARFARRFEAEFGRAPHPQAVFGYLAMNAVLEAIRRAGPDGSKRRVVIREALEVAASPRARFTPLQVDDGRVRTLR